MELVKQGHSLTTVRFTILHSSWKPWPDGLLMSVDVVADEWGTERTCWEVNSSALTCEELHYTSITSLTHSFFFSTDAAGPCWTVKISLLQPRLESWFNHNPLQKYIISTKVCTLDTSCNLMAFQSTLFYLISKPDITSTDTILHRVENLTAHQHYCAVDLYDLLETSKWLPLSLLMKQKERGEQSWLNSIT